MTEEVLENVTHQHYVFTITKIIRPYFKYDRGLLENLCLCAWETIKEFFGACLSEGTVPGAVIAYRNKVFSMLIKAGKISEDLAKKTSNIMASLGIRHP